MTIFISYRRSASKHLARLIFTELRARGHDVFLDVTTLDNGAFDTVILSQIAARPHFLLILSSGALERCANQGDWLRREIEEAFWQKRNIVPIYDEGFNIDAEKQYLPEPLRSELARLNAPPYSYYYFDAFIETLCNRFLKQPTAAIPIQPPSAADQAEAQRRIAQVSQAAPKPSSTDIMPKPFAWITIPAGKVTLGTHNIGGYISEPTTFDVNEFEIGKYPVTNAQFALFIDAQGYTDQRWWTDQGWKQCKREKWKEPSLWKDDKWNKPDYPVVGVSWHEAIAFCLWLREITNENIALPTEQQWQRAAQGDSNRTYPWGDTFSIFRCNYNSTSTASVTEYEGTRKGDSPFGVADMSGNVQEWCLTGYESGSDDLAMPGVRVLRGGSWNDDSIHNLRVDFRIWNNRDVRFNFGGFRIART